MSLFGLFKKSKASKQKSNFSAMMDALEKRRDDLFNGQRPNDLDYGFSTSNPIMTSTISSTDRYLQRLRTTDGRSFSWRRVGSFCMREVHGVEDVMVDEYKLFIADEEFKSIFVCPYGHNSSYAPAGMILED